MSLSDLFIDPQILPPGVTGLIQISTLLVGYGYETARPCIHVEPELQFMGICCPWPTSYIKSTHTLSPQLRLVRRE